MKANLLRLALKNIASRRTRSWLTILGVLVGVTAVVALLSIGTGVEEAVLQQFEDIGYDIILITSGNTGMMGMTRGEGRTGMVGGLGMTLPAARATDSPDTASSTGQTFSPDAFAGGEYDEETSTGSTGAFNPGQIAGSDDEPAGASPMDWMISRTSAAALDTAQLLEQVSSLIEAGSLGTQIQAIDTGTITGYLRVSTPSLNFLASFASVLGGFEVAEGTTFTSTAENQVIVGARSAETLGVFVGETITIADVPFTVVGILEPSGSSSDAGEEEEQEEGVLSGQGLTDSLTSGGMATALLTGMTNTDDSLFVLDERASQVFAATSVTSWVTIARVAPGTSIDETLVAISVAISEQGASGTPISVQEVADEIQGTLGLIQTVLASIAAVALIVGGVGLMNTMYTSVLERTREIGILKSVGARDGQVMTLFLIDSGLMGLIGGVLGLGLGWLLSLFGTKILGPSLGVGTFSPVVTGWLVASVLCFSFLLGAASGVWPAWRAARLNPVDALASE